MFKGNKKPTKAKTLKTELKKGFQLIIMIIVGIIIFSILALGEIGTASRKINEKNEFIEKLYQAQNRFLAVHRIYPVV